MSGQLSWKSSWARLSTARVLGGHSLCAGASGRGVGVLRGRSARVAGWGALAVASAAWGQAPTIQYLSDSHGNYDLVNNGVISFQLYTSGALAAKVTSIVYDNQQMVGSKSLYYDIQGTPNLYYGTSSVFAAPTIGSNYVILTAENPANTQAPIDTTLYWIIREGDPGFSTYESYTHTTAMADWPSSENRFAEFWNQSLFNYSSISDSFWGVQAAGMPQRSQGRFTTAETSNMVGIPSEYTKFYETKYDWRTTFQGSQNVVGSVTAANTDPATRALIPASQNFGVWNVTTSLTNESWNAGPTQPQSPWVDGASFIVTPAASHQGGPGLLYTGNMTKGFGPYFTYFNTGQNVNTMRADAESVSNGTSTVVPDLNSFYSSLAPVLQNYVGLAGRGAVVGDIRTGDGTSMTGATIILSTFDAGAYAADPISQEYQRRAAGYNYWVTSAANGSFDLANVRPGVYRVTVIKPGSYREGTWDNITVTAQGTTNVGNLPWSPDISGKGVFQIGTFDRTSAEFRDGANFNNWVDTFNLNKEFPNGVNYTVNPANPFNDTTNWSQNWALDQINGQLDFFKVNFNLASAPAANSVVTLTVSIASQEFINSLGVAIGANAQTYASFDHTADNSSVVDRSGDTSSRVMYRKITLPTSQLVAGLNTITLHIVGGQMQWDALRLDIQAPGTYSLSQWNGGVGTWSSGANWQTQQDNYTGVNKPGTSGDIYSTSTTFADGATATAPINNASTTNYYDATIDGGFVTLDVSPQVQKLSLLSGTVGVTSGTQTITANDAFVLAGATISGTGAINALTTTFVNFDNVIAGGFTVTSTGAVTFSDSSSVTVTGTGSRWVTPGFAFGTSAASGLLIAGGGVVSGGAGTITVGPAGVLSQDAASALTAGSITNAGTFTSAGPVTVAASGVFANSGTAMLTGSLSGGTVSNTGGLLTLSGTNAYTGPTLISGGTVLFGSTASIGGSGASVQVGSGGAVGFSGPGGVANATFLSRIAPSSTGALALTSADASATLNFGAAPLSSLSNIGLGAVGTVTFSGTLTPAGNTYRLGWGGALTFAPVISGTSSVVIGNYVSAGTVSLNASDSYAGGTTLRGSTLIVASLANGGAVSPIGASSNAPANLAFDGGTLQYLGSTASTTDRLFSVTANGGTLDSSGAGSLSLTNTGAVLSSGAGNRTFTLAGSAIANAFAPALADPSSGSLALVKSGTGKWTLGAATQSYSGDTSILGGTLQLGPSAALPVGLGRGNVVVGISGTLDLGGQSLSINALNDGPVNPGMQTNALNPNTPAGWATPNGPGGGAVVNSGGSATLTFGASNVSGLFSGVISGNTNLVKLGTGTQTFSGDNLYSGTTTITAGTLQVGIGGTPLSTGPGDGGFTGMLGTGNIVNNATLVFNRGYFTTVANTISGTGILKQVANAELLLGGANTYTGPTSIGGGILNIGQGGPNDGTGLAYSGDSSLNATVLVNGGLPSSIGASTSAASNLILDGGTLFYSPTSPTSTNRLFTITQNGGAIYASGPLTLASTGSVVMSGTGDRTLDLEGDAATASVFNPSIGDPAAGGRTFVTKDRSMPWILNSPTLTYSGDTTLLMGQLTLGAGVKLPYGPGKGNIAFGTSQDFSSAFNAILELNGNSENVNAISGALVGTYWSIDNNIGTVTLTFGNADASGDFLGNITGGINLVKTGLGTQTFEGTNSNTGSITINSGSLIFAATATIGGTGKNITINNGAVLGAPGTVVNQAFLGRITGSSTGAICLTSSDSNSFDFSATGANLPNVTLGAVGTATYSGALTPYAGIYRFGGGGGVLTVTSNLTGATNSLAASTNGTFILSGTNGYGGATTVSGAAIVEFLATSAASGGTSTNITLTAGGTLATGYALDQPTLNRITSGSSGVAALAANSANNLTFSTPGLANVSLGAVGTATYSGALTPAGSTYRLGGGGGALTVSSNTALTGANSLSVTGPGSVFITGSDTFTGAVTINAGATLSAALANGGLASGLGASSNAAANLVLNGGTLVGVGSTDRAFTLLANSALDNSSAFSIGTSSGSVAATPGTALTLTLTGSSTLHNTLSLNMGDPTGGQLTVAKTGVGKWTFANGVKTYSGDTMVLAGTLETLTANALSPKSNVDISAGATLDFHACNQVIAGLNGPGLVADSFGTSQVFTIGSNNAIGSFSGTIQGTLALVKIGTGTQYLTGTDTYTNATTISGGTLAFGTNASVGGVGASVTVSASGAVASLGGTTDPAFLARIAPSSTGVLALSAADATSNLSFATSPGSGLTNMYLGALGSQTYSGTLAPGSNNTLRFTGAAGTLTLAYNLTGPRTLLFGMTTGNTGGVVILSGSNNFTGGVTVQSGELRIATTSSLPSVTTALSAGSKLTLLPGAGTAGDKVFTPSALTLSGAAHNGTIAPTATLDLTNNDAILPLASYSADEVRRLIGAAYANGAWTGNGITSSAISANIGLGYMDAATFMQANPGVTTFDGLPITASQELVKYTYVGDTNLDGVVDASDLANALAGLHGGLTGWVNGDFNYDGVVTSADVNLLLTSLPNQGAPLNNSGAGPGGAGGAVPEPSALALAGVAGVALSTRRRRVSSASATA